MKFGSAHTNKLEGIDFTLPVDHPDTKDVLESSKSKSNTNIYVGCGKWGIKEWVGPLYPEGTKEKDFLEFYKNQFNSIELNNTFYKLSRTSIEKWAETIAATKFKFCPKWSRRISHLKRFKQVEENTQYFIDSCALFGSSFGASLLQVPENFSAKYMDRLNEFIQLIPDDFHVQLELRHEEWFQEPYINELYSILKNKHIGLVITDTANRRDVIHQRLTTNKVFIRFNGYGLHETDFTRMNDWAIRINNWIKLGLEECYFFCHQTDESFTPLTCKYFIEKLNEVSGLNLKAPEVKDSL